MLRRPLFSLLFLLSFLAGGAHAQASRDVSRGELLYGNHCIACHSTQMHWREHRLVTGWTSLLLQVRRWQAAAQLNWSDEDIDDVARHLNDVFYRFPAGGKALGVAPDPSGRG